MRPKLVIVQDRPTQFDVPLYALLHREAPFDLKVYYSNCGEDGGELYDPEIQRQPAWDHLRDCVYDRRFLSTSETRHVSAITDEIVAERPNLVILCGYYPRLHAKLAWTLPKRGIRIGLRSDNTLLHSRFAGPKGLLKRLLLRFWLRRYDTWHPVGGLAETYFVRVAGVRRPTFRFPYAVDNEWFGRQASSYRGERDSIRRSLGIPTDAFVVLGVGKWHEREDPLTLLRGFAIMAKGHDDVVLIFVGDGPLRDDVRHAALPFGARVILPGYQPYSKLPKFFAISDVFVHPAIDECWGVSINEAMASGVPVVASSGIGAAADLIGGGQTGVIFPSGDSNHLARILAALIADPDKLATIRSAALDHISPWSYARTLHEFASAMDVSPLHGD